MHSKFAALCVVVCVNRLNISSKRLGGSVLLVGEGERETVLSQSCISLQVKKRKQNVFIIIIIWKLIQTNEKKDT